MRQRRPTGWSPSGMNYPTGYTHPAENDRIAELKPIAMKGKCWCGKEYRHDWPGKSEGKPHPRG